MADGHCYAVTRADDKMFLGNGGYLEIMNITDPSNPASISKIALSTIIVDIEVQGDKVFLACEKQGFYIIDISDIINPTIIANINYIDSALDLDVKGDYLFVAAGKSGLRIFDISNPSQPSEVGHWRLISDINFDKVLVKNNTVYMTFYNGVYVIDITNITVLERISWISITNDTPVWQFSVGDILLVDSLLYVIDTAGLLQIFNVSEPAIPVFLASAYVEGHSAAAIYDKTLYISGGRFNDSEIHSYDISDPVYPIKKKSYITNYFAYDLIAVSNHLFLSQGVTGFYSYNLIDEIANYFIGYGTIVDVAKYNNYLLMVDSKSKFLILDITDPTNPTQIDSVQSITLGEQIIIKDNYLFTAVTANGLYIYDISDINDIRTVSFFDVKADVKADVKGIAVKNELLFMVNHNSGVHIINIADP